MPGSGRGPSIADLFRGRCVAPTCSPEQPQSCPPAECSEDTDCTRGPACTQDQCVDGLCLRRPAPDSCALAEVCDTLSGCQPNPEFFVTDAGVPDSSRPDTGGGCLATELDCTDGRDDDCDGAVDCADSDCETAACDDGLWCNGSDQCVRGVCASTGVAPCPLYCDEASGRCVECSTDDHCQTSMMEAQWSECSGFGDTCSEEGTQWREVMAVSCQQGACVEDLARQTRACSRSTDDRTCGTTTRTEWSACQGFDDSCDGTGTRYRWETTYRCGDGQCATSRNRVTEPCTRSVANGTACGAGRACCGGQCKRMDSNADCGACGISCSAIGSCQSTGTGGHACRGCTTNAVCQRELNNAATCWSPAGAWWCRCQCPVDRTVCSNGGCGVGFFCHDDNGTGANYCSNRR